MENNDEEEEEDAFTFTRPRYDINQQPITMTYCKAHDEVLLHHRGEVIIYAASVPPSPSTCQKYGTMLFWFLAISAISIYLALYPILSLPPPPPVPKTAVVESPLLHPARRRAYFSFQHENMHSIMPTIHSPTYIQSSLYFIIEHLMAAKEATTPCLCHHHLDESVSFNGIYAPVCIIPLTLGHVWQPIINPKSIPMSSVYNQFPNNIVSRVKIHEKDSLVFKPEIRWRHNTIGFHSMWPSAMVNHTIQQTWIVHDTTAHCMALALEEIDYLLTHP